MADRLTREAAMADTSRTVYMIVFDDADRKPEIVIGDLRAAYRFKEVSVSWNAHLFGKLASNCRDDPRYADNIPHGVSESRHQESAPGELPK